MKKRQLNPVEKAEEKKEGTELEVETKDKSKPIDGSNLPYTVRMAMNILSAMSTDHAQLNYAFFSTTEDIPEGMSEEDKADAVFFNAYKNEMKKIMDKIAANESLLESEVLAIALGCTMNSLAMNEGLSAFEK